MYDGINDLPITRFHLFNKYMLIDSGIGGDLDSVSGHIANISKHIEHNDTERMLQELKNYQQNLVFIMSNLTPEHLAFAVMIKTLDGKEIDTSDDGLHRVLELLNPKVGIIKKVLNELKKKLTTRWNSFSLN